MNKSCIALLCTLGIAACGGEDRPAQAPTTTTTSSKSETTATTPQPSTPSTSMMPTTPSPAPTTGTDLGTPRSDWSDTTGAGGHKMDTTGKTDMTGTTDATGLPGPSTTPTTAGTSSSDADNTKMNERDRRGTTTTPTDQGGGNDRKITAAVRRAIVGEKSLSFTAKNVKIVTTGGKVTLRGTVKSEDEKSTIEAKAKATPGVSEVENRLDVKK